MTARCLWWMQSNLGSSIPLLLAVAGAERPFAAFPRIPFSDHVPSFEWQGPVVFYGATIMTDMLRYRSPMKPLVWFDPDVFRMSRCIREWGDDVLNAGASIMTLEQLLNHGISQDRLIFIRPDEDSKAFAGEVIRFGDLEEWLGKIQGTELSPRMKVLAADPVRIEREWRVWMIGAKPIEHSTYRLNERLYGARDHVPEVLEYAAGLARRWTPAPVYCLDIGRARGRLHLVELTCFNSAGFYSADIEAIVRQVSAFVEGETT